MLAWQNEPTHAARSASALAGRPLRFIGPGNPGSTVEAGYMGTPIYDPEEPSFLSEYEDKCAYVIGMTNTLLNEECMYFDLHMHYLTADSAIGGSQEYPLGIIDMVVDTNGTGWTSNVPQATVCLEWGPRADTTHDWWTGAGSYPLNFDNSAEFRNYLNRQTPIPDRPWEYFVTEYNDEHLPWDDGQFGGDFEMPGILEALENAGYLAACCGPVGQDLDTGNSFNIAALRATLVDVGSDPPDLDNYIGNADRWTPLRTLYQTAAGEYLMGNGVFIPHPNAFDEDESCPDCQ